MEIYQPQTVAALARAWFCGASLLLPAAGATGDDTGGGVRTEDRAFLAACDGSEQKYVLVYPNSFDPNQPVSLLVALHGHGSDRWQFVKDQRDECRAVRDAAAEHGMLLLAPDYRAKTSWMGPKAEADVVQILTTLKQRFRFHRVIMCGGSMGGTGALTFAALHPEMVDGVVSLNGSADLVRYGRFLDAISASFGGTKTEVPGEYRRRSARFFPERFTMPLAATTGGQDTVVPPDSVLELLEAVRKHNSNVLRIHRPNTGHSTNYEDTKRAIKFVIEAPKNVPREPSGTEGSPEQQLSPVPSPPPRNGG